MGVNSQKWPKPVAVSERVNSGDTSRENPQSKLAKGGEFRLGTRRVFKKKASI